MPDRELLELLLQKITDIETRLDKIEVEKVNQQIESVSRKYINITYE